MLPYEIVIEIAGLVAATSPHPMEDLCSLSGTYVSAVHPRMSRITYTFNLSTCIVRVSLQLPDQAHAVHGARREELRSARAGGIHEVIIDAYINLLKA